MRRREGAHEDGAGEFAGGGEAVDAGEGRAEGGAVGVAEGEVGDIGAVAEVAADEAAALEEEGRAGEPVAVGDDHQVVAPELRVPGGVHLVEEEIP